MLLCSGRRGNRTRMPALQAHATCQQRLCRAAGETPQKHKKEKDETETELATHNRINHLNHT